MTDNPREAARRSLDPRIVRSGDRGLEAMTDNPREAARRSLDPERLLPGEDIESSDRETAARWAQVYRELMETKQMMAANLTAAVDRVSSSARAELKTVDLVLIRFQLDRFERRYQYWSECERKLTGAGARRL
jgi:hypothetical protein